MKFFKLGRQPIKKVFFVPEPLGPTRDLQLKWFQSYELPKLTPLFSKSAGPLFTTLLLIYDTRRTKKSFFESAEFFSGFSGSCRIPYFRPSLPPSVPPSVRSDLTHFQVEQLHQTFRICLQGAQDYAHHFFWSKNFQGQRSRSKRSKTVKFYLLLQFSSQDVQIFVVRCPHQGGKMTEAGILIGAPDWARGPQKCQNFQILVKNSISFYSFRARTFKFS